MDYELRELSFGETIGKAFNLYVDNFLPIFAMSLISIAPSFVFGIMEEKVMTDGVMMENLLSMDQGIISSIITFVTTAIMQGVMIDFISRRYLGHDTYLSDTFKDAPNYIGRLIGLSIVSTIIVVLPALIAIIPFLGWIVALIAILVLSISLSFAPHVMVIEKTGIIEALDRSWYLAGKNRLKIAGILLVTGIITSVLSAVVMAVMNINFYDITTLLAQMNSEEFIIASSIIRALSAPFTSCALILMYFNLRIQKDGFDIEHLARRFSDLDDQVK